MLVLLLVEQLYFTKVHFCSSVKNLSGLMCFQATVVDEGFFTVYRCNC